jgi:hypothetical protein
VVAGDLKLSALPGDFLEQSSILYCDHGLIGNGDDEFNLLWGEGAHCVARQDHHADRSPYAQQREIKHSTKTSDPLSFAQYVLQVDPDNGNVDRAARTQHSSRY